MKEIPDDFRLVITETLNSDCQVICYYPQYKFKHEELRHWHALLQDEFKRFIIMLPDTFKLETITTEELLVLKEIVDTAVERTTEKDK